MKRNTRLAAAGATVLALLLVAPSADASATVTRFAGTNTGTFTAALEGCLPSDLIGTATVTETSTGEVIDTGGGVVIVHGINAYDFHMVFPDGRYVQSGLDRDVYTWVSQGPHTVFNLVGVDLRTIYAPDGTPIGTLSIHAGSHLSYNDRNGNGVADPDEITASFDWFRLRCG